MKKILCLFGFHNYNPIQNLVMFPKISNQTLFIFKCNSCHKITEIIGMKNKAMLKFKEYQKHYQNLENK